MFIFVGTRAVFVPLCLRVPKTVLLQGGAAFTQRLYQGQKENNFTEWLLKVHV